jgi:tRNA-specific 2-thiouridylase
MVFFIVICTGAFLEAIENLGFDYIASGHYAHVVHPSVENTEAPSVLQLSKDKVLRASFR